MKTLTLRLDEALYEKVSFMAKQRKTTQSEVVRGAIKDSLGKSNGTSKASALDLGKDLAGILSGPSNLSFNKTHLKRFGR